MKAYSVLLLFALLVVLDVVGCSPRPVRHTDPVPEMTDDRIYEVKGKIFSIYTEDLSKSRKQQNLYTHVAFWVEESKNLANPDLKLRTDRISMQRKKKFGDDELEKGKVYTFKVGVSEVGGNTYYYWLD